ncbi:MAG: hypothetical protein ACXAEI_07555 [Candidatus Hodarchaeales archaeon]
MSCIGEKIICLKCMDHQISFAPTKKPSNYILLHHLFDHDDRGVREVLKANGGFYREIAIRREINI